MTRITSPLPLFATSAAQCARLARSVGAGHRHRENRFLRERDRLASLPRPANGRREAMLIHPRAAAPGKGLAPGIRVVLSVLKPGEETAPIRHNSTQVKFCIGGSGSPISADGGAVRQV